jgi:glycosyltransferase involved in cell wall biosynthesis
MSDISKKVSVVMSVYGYEEYINDSIKSILEQTLKDFEFIIIDDDCDYDLSKQIKQFDDSRIIYIKNHKNIGLTRSLIKGIKKSAGKYIARHDAGNISLENRLETQYDFLEKNNQYYLVGSSVELIDENNNTICKIIANDNPDYIRKKMPSYNCINHSTIMFRNKGEACYHEKFRYSQDYDFYLNLLSNKYVLGNISEVLLKERIMPSSITYSRKNKQEYFRIKARQFYFERMKSGSDSYDLMDASGNIGKIKQQKTETDGISFYGKQKIYYLLFSGRTGEARRQILSLLKVKFNFKLFIYLVVSFFPFMIRLSNKLKGLQYK